MAWQRRMLGPTPLTTTVCDDYRGMARPHILLIPSLTELEWLIKAQLAEWADVASFDAPGVGDEPRPDSLDRGAIVQRALVELERTGWESCFVVADSWGIATAVQAALAWPGEILGLALGHARLSNRTEGERPPVNRVVWEAMGQLIQNDYRAFVRYGLTQLTQGSIGDELAERMLERVPTDLAQTAYETMLRQPEPIGDDLRRLDMPLLFAKHEGCLSATEEGYEDAVAAFPTARTVAVADAPTVSPEFADALRSFCEKATAASAAT
jgi:pimeloyl-ACP methyl ester carboxylesterase